MSAQGVFTRDLRARFVEKTISEVGDQTEFPMEVSWLMMEEILYRVKAARFDGGQITTYWDDSDLANYPDQATLLVAPSVAPPTTPYHEFSSTDWFYTRGYTTPAPVRTYLTTPIAYVDTAYTAGDFGGTITSRADVLDRERVMWLPEFSDKIADAGVTTDFTTAFSFDSESVVFPTTDTQIFEIQTAPVAGGVIGTTSKWGTGFSVVFTGEIGVVKASGSADLMYPGNTFYLGLRVRNGRKREPLSTLFGFPGVSSIPSEEGFFAPFHCGNYEIQLASAPYPSCKLYSDETNVPSGDYPASPGIGTIIHKATEWWPYAKDSPAVPVWDSATGVKL